MIIYIHSDAFYLSVSKARSRASDIFFLSDNIAAGQDIQVFMPVMSSLVHVVCKIFRNIMALTADAELGIVFINAQYEVPI